VTQPYLRAGRFGSTHRAEKTSGRKERKLQVGSRENFM